MREEVIQSILKNKIIAIVRGIFDDECVCLAEALHSGGVELMEVTFDQKDESEQEKTIRTIRSLNEKLGTKMYFGAGTVTSIRMVSLAKAAGALFIVSPNTDESVIRATIAMDMVSIPGALTPTEIAFAHNCGGDFIKVFPANHVGPDYFKAIHAPLSSCRLLAVGSVNENNLKEYISAGAVGAGVAGCLFKKEWVKNREWERIRETTQMVMEKIKE